MHWRVMMFAVAVAFLGASVAGQDHSDIESAIDALAATYTEGWNSGDAAACASTYTEDAYSIQITGERFDGRSAIEGNIQETLTRNGSSTIEIVRTSMHVVKPDLVVVDGTWTVSGSSAENAPTSGFYTLIATNENGEWRIRASQSKVAPPSGE